MTRQTEQDIQTIAENYAAMSENYRSLRSRILTPRRMARLGRLFQEKYYRARAILVPITRR